MGSNDTLRDILASDDDDDDMRLAWEANWAFNSDGGKR